MGFDVKEKITGIVAKIKNDPKLVENFQKDPEKTIESVAGIDIPDGQLDAIISGVKAQLTAGKLSGVADKLGGLFKKD
ncbi:MAG: hypothetical protein Q4D54_05890 [Eubacteriales bacterium]|nr:hypothetical protein [Lachnospiraceae bacterium]MDO5127264.1 hypothetical protein [Eubacteriales bacterium]